MTWLYLPSSVYSQEQAGDYLPQSTCSAGEPSVMSNGIGMPSKSSRPASGTDTLTMPQYGTTLLLSTGNPGLDSWMLSLRASLASRSVQPGKDSPSETPATDGRQLSASFAKYDPAMRSWRMFPVLSLSHISDEYLGTWPKRASISGMIAYRLKKSVRRIFAKDYGLLPTPKAATGHYQRDASGKEKLTLMGMAHRETWPTPQSRDWRRVQIFSTPNTRGIDGSSTTRKAAKERGTFVVGSGGALNPTWVEWLMGWPLGWTDLQPLETGRFRQWLEQHGTG
jgi:hypothetical protein